jgi:secreted PhoX family phosphatase
MKKTIIAAAIGAVVTTTAMADKPAVNGPFSFEPLTASAAPGSEPACAPLKLPEGFSQTVLVQEHPVCDAFLTVDVVSGQNDLTDMNVVNETGAHAGRFLYSTHENSGGKGAISAVDLKTGEVATYTGEDFGGWSRLDGIDWTPWGTLLAAEENGAFGRLFECEVDGLELSCVDRPAVGRMSHEGIVAAPNGNVYVGDELNGGSIYRFVPEQYGDLSSGTLYALNIPGSTTVCSGSTGVGVTPTGQAEWVALDIAPGQSARDAANAVGASDYCRPEDAELIGPNLYFATTTTKNVLQIPVNTETPVVTEFAGINTNMNNESDVPSYGLHSPDNLASDNAGNLYIVEDNSSEADVWVATPDRNNDGASDSVVLFTTLTTIGAEGTGIYFPRTMPKTMLINVQHAADGNDMTMMITKD